MRGFLLGMILLAAVVGCSSQGQEEVYRVGILLPFTGNIGEYGERIKRGIELAREEIKDLKIELLYEDTQGSPRVGVSAARKLINMERVRYLIGAVSSSVTLAVEPIATQSRVLLFSPASSSPKLSGISPFFIRNWPSDDLEAEAMARYAYQDLGLRRVVIFYVENDYGRGLEERFRKTFESLGGQVLASERYPYNHIDFRAFLTKYKNRFSTIDAFYIGGYHREMGFFVKQLRELGFKGTILAATNFSVPEALAIAGEKAEGVWVSTPYSDFSRGKARRFYERFKAKFGYEPSQFEVNGYDALMLLAEGLRRFGYKHPEKIGDYLRRLKNYEGAGGVMSFTPEGDVIKRMAIQRVKNGRLETVKVFTPNELL